MSYRVAILGSRGIGFFHTRIFQQLGNEICGVLGTSPVTVKKAVESLSGTYGILPKTYINLDQLMINEDPDIVSICTPPEYHLDHMKTVLEKGKAVFCEKPIFWHKSINYKEIDYGIKTLREYSNPILHVNTSNASFISYIRDRIDSAEKIENFNLEFFTNGSCSGYEIAVDLLPHGLSMILELFGMRSITHFSDFAFKKSYSCKFNFGNCIVNFNFSQGKNINKRFAFSINGRKFLRVQQIDENKKYKVYLKDIRREELIRVDDPFEVYIKRFLDNYNRKDMENQKIIETAFGNIKLMADILLR